MTTSTDNPLDISAQLFWQSTTPTSSATQTESVPALSQSGSTSVSGVARLRPGSGGSTGAKLVSSNRSATIEFERQLSTCDNSPVVLMAWHDHYQYEGDGEVSGGDDEVDGVGDKVGNDKAGGVGVIPGPQWTTAFGSMYIRTADLLWAAFGCQVVVIQHTHYNEEQP
ncbi:uncharacterized protein UHOD_12048 [Ustilago sp. UG-2017b]|nr:uncharacterized protein UHOD_12048 [Ustilago sp. UG-2017b]